MSPRTLTVAGTTKLHAFDNISHMQDAAALAAEYFGGRPSFEASGVAIMADGKLRALGPPDQLRDRFCKALYINIEASSPEARKRVEAELLTGRGGPPRLGEGTVDRVGSVLKVSVSRGEEDGDASSKALRIADLFRTVQSLSKEGIRFYSVAEPTLEDVLLVVVKASRGADAADLGVSEE
jgi:ABC-type multidrug transport system ATPase subunit